MLNSMLFLVFVAVAVYAQNLTGFALALVLLGLTGAAGILPLPDVVNAVSIIAVVNAAVFLYRRRALRLDRKLWPLLIASTLGTMLGIAALAWIMGNAYELLRLEHHLLRLDVGAEQPNAGRRVFAKRFSCDRVSSRSDERSIRRRRAAACIPVVPAALGSG